MYINISNITISSLSKDHPCAVQKYNKTLKTGSFCRCFSMERAVWGLKMMGAPVVSELRSRSSEIPGASVPGAKQMVKMKIGCFI